MKSYTDSDLAQIKRLLDAEVREGVRSFRASYLSHKYGLGQTFVQKALSDLAAAGDLQTHYQLLCSGEKQRYDADREFADRREIPRHEITCRECGDIYIPAEENIRISFEPTKAYTDAVTTKS